MSRCHLRTSNPSPGSCTDQGHAARRGCNLDVAPEQVAAVRRLTPYLLLAVLMLGTGLGIGLGLSEAPTGVIEADGQINGTVNIVVGGATYRPYSGTTFVSFWREDRPVQTVSVSSGHEFQVWLPPGRYGILIGCAPVTCDPCLRTEQPNGLLLRRSSIVPTSEIGVGPSLSVEVNFSCIVHSALGKAA